MATARIIFEVIGGLVFLAFLIVACLPSANVRGLLRWFSTRRKQ